MLRLLLVVSLVVMGTAVFDVLDFGALPNSDAVVDQFINTKAILAAIHAANISEGERVVRIPNHKFYSMPIRVDNVHNLTLLLYGKLIASKNVLHWPKRPSSTYYEDFLSFHSCSYI